MHSRSGSTLPFLLAKGAPDQTCNLGVPRSLPFHTLLEVKPHPQALWLRCSAASLFTLHPAQHPLLTFSCPASGHRRLECQLGSPQRMASLARPPTTGLCTATFLLSVLLSRVCHAQITPAPSPLLAEVASTPVFAGQSFNATVSAVDQNAIVTARPDFAVRSAPERLSACESSRLMTPTTPAGPVHSASRCTARPAEAWAQQQQSRRLPLYPQHVPRAKTITLDRLLACCWAQWP